MANILKIKRSDNANGNAPTSLARGELAYHEVTDTLYIGSGTETGGDAANQPVVAGPLNLMPAPTANVSLNSKRITNLATPTSSNDAVTKAYVDAVQTGLDVKGSVRVASTAQIQDFPDPSSAPTIDGVTLQDQDRVLVKNETGTLAKNNGIWVWNNSGSVFSRASDADNTPAGEVTSGMFTFVEEGTVNANSGFVLSTTGSITLGTTSLAFSQFSGAGQITAGDGLDKSGNTLSVMLVPSGGLDFATHAGKEKITVNYSDANALGTLPITKGGTGGTDISSARSGLGLEIGNHVQGYDPDLNTIAGFTPADGVFIVGSGSSWVAESGTTVRTSLGLGTMSTQNSNSVNITGGTINMNDSQSVTIDCGTF